MGVSNNNSWYGKARSHLLEQKKIIYDASNKEMPDRYQRHCEIVNELEKLERWRESCSISSPSP